MRFKVENVKSVESKEVKKVLSDWRNGIISKSDCIEKLFFEMGLSDSEIKDIEELEVAGNSMVYNVCKSRGLKRGLDIRNCDMIESSRNSSKGLNNEYIEFLDKYVESKKGKIIKLNDIVISFCLSFGKSEVYSRKVIKKYEELKNIKFVKSR